MKSTPAQNSQHPVPPDNAQGKGWIGVDLDGTLAHYESAHGVDIIGAPIDDMVFRIRQWLDAGLTVKVFTARASNPELIPPIQEWLAQHQLPDLPVTHQKDYDLLQLWDDRAIQLETNTAELLTPKQHINLSVSGWVGVELDGTLAIASQPQHHGAIGPAIDKMRMRVQQWLMVGMDVRLFTARARDPEQIPRLQQWLRENRLEKMGLTCEKDFAMSQFWDDRAIHVISNSGQATGRIEQLIPQRRFI